MRKRHASYQHLAAAIIFLLALVVGVASAATSVSFEFTGPDGILPGKTGAYRATISPNEAVSGFDLAVLVPSGWSIDSWSASGYSRSAITLDTRSRSYRGLPYTAYHWKFANALSAGENISFSLNVKVPETEAIGTRKEISAIWTNPSGFGTENRNVSIASASILCGDGACSSGETCSTCPKDCGVCWTPVCGDGACSPGEVSCQADCGNGNTPVNTPTTAGNSGSIFGTFEGSRNYLLYGGLIVLVLALIMVAIYVVRKVSGRPRALEPSQPIPLEEYNRAQEAGSPLRDQVSGRFDVRPVNRQLERATVTPREIDTTEKKIVLLKKAMMRINKVMDDLGKNL
ncbi:MAG: hypothetical protein V1820_03620 [archaeon]